MYAKGCGIILNTVLATRHGLGQHVWLLPMPTLFETIKSCILVCDTPQISGACFEKLAAQNHRLE